MNKLKITENQTTQAIIQYLTLKKWRVWKIYNGSIPARVFGNKIIYKKKKVEERGLPDLFCMREGFPMLWLEVKSPGGRVRPEQKDFIERAMKTQNGWAHVVWLVDEVIELNRVLEDKYKQL